MDFNKNISFFHEFCKENALRSFPMNLLNDGLIKSVDINIVVNKLDDLFKNNKDIIDYNKQSTKEVAKFQIISEKTFYPKNFRDILDKISSILNVCGYIISSYKINNEENVKSSVLQTDTYRNDIKSFIFFIIKKYNSENDKGIPEFLYHVTDIKNVEKINNIGLVPKSKNKIENHPDRIYLFSDIKLVDNFLKRLEDNISEYCVLKIDMKISGDIKLYIDGSYGSDGAYYTYDNISPLAIDLVD